MCKVLSVPVRVHAYTKGADPVDLGIGWIRGVEDVQVAWVNGEIFAMAVGGFTAKEEKDLLEQGAHLGTIPDQPVFVPDSNTSCGMPCTCLSYEYIYDAESA